MNSPQTPGNYPKRNKLQIGTASNETFAQTEFKLGNKIIGTNQSAKIFKNYFINSVDELITQQPNTESAVFSLRESFPYEFPQIINIPITKTELICAISSLKNKTSCGYDGLVNKTLKLHSSQISKPITYIFSKSLTCGICPKSPKACYYKTIF